MKRKNIKSLVLGIVCSIFSVVGLAAPTFADAGITLSPLNQKIVLTPGETYQGSFRISNQAANTEDVKYKITIEPFHVDDNYDIKYENNGDMNQMVDWIKINDSIEGNISPNEGKDIHYSVDVPKDAPAGGQYAAIKITSVPQGEDLEGGLNLKVSYGMAYIMYGEIAGTTERKGEITDISVPSFMFDGKISGTSSVKNTGNVHGEAINKLQVFPLFSNEEVYSNVEKPENRIILPGTTRTNVTTWEETPSVGIFNVVYNVEFEGVTKEVKKMVIICPIWLLVIIIAIILLLIFFIFAKSKKSKKNK